MGRQLASTLNRLLREKAASNEEPEARISAAAASAAGIDAGTLGQIRAGDINCPPIARLRGLARYLDVELSTLTAAARRDGCTAGASEPAEE